VASCVPKEYYWLHGCRGLRRRLHDHVARACRHVQLLDICRACRSGKDLVVDLADAVENRVPELVRLPENRLDRRAHHVGRVIHWRDGPVVVVMMMVVVVVVLVAVAAVVGRAPVRAVVL